VAAIRIEVQHTADLGTDVLDAARLLMLEAFEGDFGPSDWEHTLGGMHALVWEDDALVAHGSMVQRRLLYEGRALRCGYVEAVGVRPDRQRRGYGAAVMDALERLIRGAYDLGALGTTDEGYEFYLARGWQAWSGETYALTPSGVVRTEEDDGGVLVLPVTVALDPSVPLTCDWRDGDVW
jgi:aminoglycoside 2'-N-acetyltransferase I